MIESQLEQTKDQLEQIRSELSRLVLNIDSLGDFIDAETKIFEDKIKPAKTDKMLFEQQLVGKMKELGVSKFSLDTGETIALRRTYPYIGDSSAQQGASKLQFIAWLKDNDELAGIVKVVEEVHYATRDASIDDYLSRGGELPPMLKVSISPKIKRDK